MSETMNVGKKLVELCREGKAGEAMDTLYDASIVSVEAGSPGGGPASVEGMEAVKAKAAWFEGAHEIHGIGVEGPFPNGDRFIVRFKYDVTAKAGPMAGQRFILDEGALYTVAEGKIVKEEFFYSMG